VVSSSGQHGLVSFSSRRRAHRAAVRCRWDAMRWRAGRQPSEARHRPRAPVRRLGRVDGHRDGADCEW